MNNGKWAFLDKIKRLFCRKRKNDDELTLEELEEVNAMMRAHEDRMMCSIPKNNIWVEPAASRQARYNRFCYIVRMRRK